MMAAPVPVLLMLDLMLDFMLDRVNAVTHGHPPWSIWEDDVANRLAFARGNRARAAGRTRSGHSFVMPADGRCGRRRAGGRYRRRYRFAWSTARRDRAIPGWRGDRH